MEKCEPDKVYQLGETTVYIYAPKNLSLEEIERREDVMYDAIADILRSLPSAKQGA